MTLITNLDAAPIVPRGGSRASIASFTRHTGTTAYTAGDVVSDDEVTTAKAIVFPGCGAGGLIHGATVAYEDIQAIALQLLVFDTEPTNFLDNAAFALVTGDLPKLVGIFALAIADGIAVGADISFWQALDVAAGSRPSAKTYSTVSGGNLFGLLRDMTGHTPTASTKVHVRLHLEAVGDV